MATIAECARLGVNIKMITGNQLIIAKELAKRLGMQRVRWFLPIYALSLTYVFVLDFAKSIVVNLFTDVEFRFGRCIWHSDWYHYVVLRQDQSWFDLAELDSLNSRLSSDKYLIQEGISDKVGYVIKNITQVTSGFVMAFIFGWRLSLILIAVLPLLGLSGYIFSSVIKSQTVKAQDAYSNADFFS
ncbi:uncharacterized protein VTP21DRAFT_4292 [Calcarisporiella thermophila]|uniref:uncharacterized protein n=1 Tax=Calcarisporiella thermophila TaxID=911321 RepID=UPI003741F731